MYERIDTLLMEHGYNDSDLAVIAGVGKSTVSGWRSGKFNPKKNKLENIARHFGVTVEWLMGVSDYRTKSEQDTMDILFDSRAQTSNDREIFEVAAGDGRINGDYPGGLSDDIDYESGEYVDAVISGDSMYPVIMDGDTITIHLQRESHPDPKKISVVKIGDEATTIKYAEVADNGIWIRAENKEVFPDTFYDIIRIMDTPIRILGTVVAVRRRL